MSRITEVRYAALRSFGNFQNETVGIAMSVDGSDHPGDVLAVARQWVSERLDERGEIQRVRADVREKEYELERLEQNIARAREQIERIEAFFQKLGMEVPWRGWSDVPF